MGGQAAQHRLARIDQHVLADRTVAADRGVVISHWALK
jgi:hypothetical protein